MWWAAFFGPLILPSNSAWVDPVGWVEQINGALQDTYNVLDRRAGNTSAQLCAIYALDLVFIKRLKNKESNSFFIRRLVD